MGKLGMALFAPLHFVPPILNDNSANDAGGNVHEPARMRCNDMHLFGGWFGVQYSILSEE